jgi:hypothetical protein
MLRYNAVRMSWHHSQVFECLFPENVGRGSVVDIATCYGLDGPEIESLGGGG